MAKEKAQLVGLGYPVDLVRLYCYSLASPRLVSRYDRFAVAFELWHKQLGLFDGNKRPCCKH